MMQMRQLSFLVPCGLGIILLAAGCSRNVTSVDAVAAPPVAVSSQGIPWQPSLESALAAAKSQGKPVMIDFYATWCAPCKLLDQQIYPDSKVVQEAKNFVSVKVDVDIHSEAVRKYQVGGLPTVVFLDAAGKEVHRLVGLADVEGEASQFAQLLRKVHSGMAARPS